MGKHIRRTVTITITETWIIAWWPGDDHVVGAKRHPLPYPPTVEQEQTNTEEEPDETLPTTLTLAASVPTPPTQATAVDPQLDNTANNSTARRRGKGTRVRRAKGNRSKQ